MDKNDGLENSSAGASAEADLRVEVAYALPQRQRIIELHVKQGSTAWDAVQQSGITLEFPDIDVESADMGVFSKPLDGKVLPLPKDYRVKARDRVEIYRPLLVDPKAARQARAARAKETRALGNEAGNEAESGAESGE